MSRSALLLTGSHRRGRSTSAVLGDYLLSCLEPHGFQGRRIDLRNGAKHARQAGVLREAVEESDLTVLSFPLYVDTLPSSVTESLEALYAAHQQTPMKPVGFAAIANSGFPEAHHNDVALEVCRHFAMACGLRWLGGLAVGGGEAFKGRRLEWFLPLTLPMMQALRWTAAALAAGLPVPEAARRRMARPLMPNRLFYPIATFRWYRAAFRAGVHQHMRDRHYPCETRVVPDSR